MLQKISVFGKRPNTVASILATTSNQNFLSWDNEKLSANLDKKIERPPQNPEQVHDDVDCWTEDKTMVRRRRPMVQDPEIINRYCNMTEGQGSKLKQFKTETHNMLREVETKSEIIKA